MKIALVNSYFSLTHGGLERFSVNLATMLAADGHEVHAFGQRFADLPEAVICHVLAVPRKPAWRRILAFHLMARKAVEAQKFDVVYGLTRFSPLDIYRMGDGVQKHWLRLRYPNRFWRWFNCFLNPVHLVNLWLEALIFQNERCRIVTNSKLCKEQAQIYYAVPAERIDVIYNGVDHQLFNEKHHEQNRIKVRSELGITADDIVILHVSNNWKRKGLPVLMEALSQLGSDGHRLHLVVVGRGRSEPFHALATKLGIDDRLHLVGATQQVHEYFAACDVMVLPTMYDPFSNVCLEAMACSRAVITTAQNGAAELIQPGMNGLIQKDAHDAGELAGLLSLCLDQDRLRAMGAAAEVSARPYTLEKNMRETCELFRRIRS